MRHQVPTIQTATEDGGGPQSQYLDRVVDVVMQRQSSEGGKHGGDSPGALH